MINLCWNSLHVCINCGEVTEVSFLLFVFFYPVVAFKHL